MATTMRVKVLVAILVAGMSTLAACLGSGAKWSVTAVYVSLIAATVAMTVIADILALPARSKHTVLAAGILFAVCISEFVMSQLLIKPYDSPWAVALVVLLKWLVLLILSCAQRYVANRLNMCRHGSV